MSASRPGLIETPLGTTRAMMDFIAQAADKGGMIVEVAENMRRQPPAQLARRAIDAGLIGRVLRVSTWYESIGQQGSYHQMSLLQFYAGAEAIEARAFAQSFALEDPEGDTRHPNPPPPGGRETIPGQHDEIWTQALLSFPNGALGSCTYVSSWLTPLRRGHPRFITIDRTIGFITVGRGEQTNLYQLEGGSQVRYPMKTDTESDGKQMRPVRFRFETIPPVGGRREWRP